MPSPTYQSLPILLLLLLLPNPSTPKQCTYNPTTFSTTSTNPMNPLTNCLEYCSQYYSESPQRAYYNITSQDCQPRRWCNRSTSFYNYVTNLCYKDQMYKVEDDSYVPETTVMGVTVVASQTSEMVCVNGQYSLMKIGGTASCLCNLLWKSSGLLDMNGFPFFCDIVTPNPDRYFYDSLKYDKNGNITNYGPFTAEQMQALLTNLASVQAFQVSQYTLNQTDSIMYAINTWVPQEPIVRPHEYPYLIIFVVGVLVVFGISYWEYEKIRVRVRESGLKRRVLAVLGEQNFVRDAL